MEWRTPWENVSMRAWQARVWLVFSGCTFEALIREQACRARLSLISARHEDMGYSISKTRS
eukprot:1161773-Pelagomonas_calceolata.AAC.2